MHHFANKQVKLFDHIHWDILYLFDELKKGMIKAVGHGHRDIVSIGVDTWGVDFGLIGKNNVILGYPYVYRDSRTDGMIEYSSQFISKEELYSYSGIQFMQLNSIFQLLSMVKSEHPLLEVSETLLFMPDLFNYFMTGEKYSEYTIASTSQLLNVKKEIGNQKYLESLVCQ